MARDPKYDVLFEPVRIGPKMIKNRFYQTPHCTSFGSELPGAQAHFRAVKAEGGWGAVNLEMTSVHPEDDQSPHIEARLWDETDVRNLSLVCERVHEQGGLIGVELGYGGSHAGGLESRLPSRAPSQISSETTWFRTPVAMDKQEIRELQKFFVAAARRARTAGFDLVTVFGGECASIPLHFLMRYFNKRTDEYGGSLENRARFWLELLELVREAVGDDCAVVARFCVDTLHDDDRGIRVDEEGVGFIELADHLVDLWDLQVGGSVAAEWGDDAGPSRFFSENFQRPWVEKVRPHTSKPIVGVGRFINPDTMVAVIRSGQLDLIGAARPTISDPFLPKKIEEGRLDDIRECIGCNICVSRWEQVAAFTCTQNPTAGEEYRRGWHPERFDRARNAERSVLVVGAGPAGMECAMVLGKRGLRSVQLVEARAEMGGSMRWISQLPGLSEFGRVVSYRETQIGKLDNVQFVPDTQLDAASVREHGVDIVVVATGARWATDGLSGTTHDTIPGADARLPYCLTPEQMMDEGKEVPGDTAVVYDCDGYLWGVSLAEKLAREGKRVTIVTPYPQIGPYMFQTLEGARMNRLLHRLDVELVPSHVVDAIEAGTVSGHHVFAADRRAEWTTDGVVLVTQRLSRDRLYLELKDDPDALREAGIQGLHRIGDCLAPRIVADAIFDGHRLAREIDTANPAVALPFIRERRVLGASDEDFDGVLGERASAYRPTSVLERA